MTKHPGRTLLEDFMTPLGLTANKVAIGLGVHRSTIGRLIAGEQRVTPEIAARLGAYFQVPAKWWLSMQVDYDAQELARRPALREGVTPLELDPNLLLTPTGIMHLDEPDEAQHEPLFSISRAALEEIPQTSVPQPREVRLVRYANGSIALVGEGI